MSINLHDIIADPEKTLPFEVELSTERFDFTGVSAYNGPIIGKGYICNDGGALSLKGVIEADMTCICDRCASEYEVHKTVHLDEALARELEDEGNPDFYLLNGDELDIEDLLESCFILDMDNQFLCRDDCRGICAGCGVNLNTGICRCTKERDPRLAVLEQLLDDKK